MSKWMERMKAIAKESIAKLEAGEDRQAKALIEELRSAGVSFETDGQSLKARGPLTEEHRRQIKQNKTQILEALRAGTPPSRQMVWGADQFGIQVSLSSSGIPDMMIGPAVESLGVPLQPEFSALLLEGASPEWRAAAERMGGLKAYALSQWAEAKPKLEEALRQ